MKFKEYENVEQLLHSSGKFRIKLGLERILSVLDLLGNPQEKINVIHVAGTNGKGSVCTLTAEALISAGYKTALYTSPHLRKYNERFKINGQDISDEIFAEYITEINNIAEKNNIDLSEFEILTASAYKYFYDNNVDFAVMETGLGGRYDAVNVIKKPIITAITSISIDHKDRLGDTIEKIAYEKAGIIKNNTPIILNEDNKGLEIIRNIAYENKAEMYLSDKKIDILYKNKKNYANFDNKEYEYNLWGLHQKQNLALVLKIIDILKQQGIKITDRNIEIALKKAFIPARFQYLEQENIIIDGAHNADAASKLRKNLDYYFPDKERIWIYGTISTKEYDKVINTLLRNGDKFCPVDFKYPLAVPTEEIIAKISDKSQIKLENFSKPENILNFFNPNSIKIITGSFYMIGDLFFPLVIL